MIKSSATNPQKDTAIVEPFTLIIEMPQKLTLNKDLLLEVDSDSSSQKSIGLLSSTEDKNASSLTINRVSNIKKIEDEGSSLEKEDKIKINAVRTQFYALNERFEQLLKFKPIRKLNLWSTEMNLEAAYQIFSAFKIEESLYSMDD